MAYTTDPSDALLYINNGSFTARWNFPDAVGSPLSNPAGLGDPVTITYSFLSGVPSYATSDGAGFLSFDSMQRAATRQVLDWIEDATNVHFIETTGVAQMTFGNSSQSLSQSGYAYGPSYGYRFSASNIILSTSESPLSGDVWINRNSAWTSDSWQPGGFGYQTLFHEIGHALGLKHPFEGNWLLDPQYDNTDFTVMSYTEPPNSAIVTVSGSSSSYSWRTSHVGPSTYMALDLVALQQLYGENRDGHGGNDVYHWDTNEEFFQTIWDGGGNDTIDCSNQVYACSINLDDYAYSSIGLRQTYAELHDGLDLPSWFLQTLPGDVYDGRNNLAIAWHTTIENAIGGSGNDTILGNGVANRLTGGGGNDSLSGGAGNDVLNGGTGADTMRGGSGNDLFYVAQSGDRVLESSGQGADTVYSSVGSLTLAANVENGRILNAGSANLTGNGLNNIIYAGAGNNVMGGGSGTDTLSYAYAGAGVTLNLGRTAGQATGGSGTDTVSGFENLAGSGRGDQFTGSSGNNVLNGAGGNDRLSGAGGNDKLIGGMGQDRLTGGSGRDIFDFNALGESGLSASTRDILLDFVRGQDHIDLASIDANGGVAGNSAFSFIGSAAFGSNAAGQLRYAWSAADGFGILYGSTDADRAAEFSIQVAGVSTLSASDFLL